MGLHLPPAGEYAAGMLFLPINEQRCIESKNVFNKVIFVQHELNPT